MSNPMNNPDAESAMREEIVDIIARLMPRAGQAELMSPDAVWREVSGAREEEDMELLRAYDACYSREHNFIDIDRALNLLRTTKRIGEPTITLTPAHLASFKKVRLALDEYTTERKPWDSPLRHVSREQLKLHALRHPEHGAAICAIVLEREITKYPEVLALLNDMDKGSAALSEGVL